MATGRIANIGNTCCINTFFQCIAHTPKLNNYFINKNKNSELYNQIKEILTIIGNDTNNVCYPHKCIQILNKYFPNEFTLGEQYDMSEVLTLIFDKISIEIGKPTNIELCNNNIINKINTAIHNYNNSKSSSFIKNIQNTQLSILNCSKCDFEQINVEVYITLMLDISNEKDFYTIISNYFKKDTVSDWLCDKCKILNNANKSIKLWDLPEILIVVLKRFKYSENGSISKINTSIEIPDNITFGKGSILKYNDKEYKYNLCAIANHIGNYMGGHYYAYCNYNNEWYCYDDNTRNKLDKINYDNAYVLFYQKSN